MQNSHDTLDNDTAITLIIESLSHLAYIMASDFIWDKNRSFKALKNWMFSILCTPGKSSMFGIDTDVMRSCQEDLCIHTHIHTYT